MFVYASEDVGQFEGYLDSGLELEGPPDPTHRIQLQLSGPSTSLYNWNSKEAQRRLRFTVMGLDMGGTQ